MSRILLIKPRFFTGFWHQESVTQPMGLMYISAVLKSDKHELRIHDCGSDHQDLKTLKRTITDWQPDFIGISIIVTEVDETRRVMGIIRKIMPVVPVIFGGPWPSANFTEAIREFGADFVVIGEGELVFKQLIDAVNNGLSTESIAGTASLINGEIKGLILLKMN